MQLEMKIRAIMQGNIYYENQLSCGNYGNYNQDGWILIQGLGEEVGCFSPSNHTFVDNPLHLIPSGAQAPPKFLPQPAPHLIRLQRSAAPCPASELHRPWTRTGRHPWRSTAPPPSGGRSPWKSRVPREIPPLEVEGPRPTQPLPDIYPLTGLQIG